ncbi:MAG TPA: serine/threonine-protein kinase [Thermoanaerobaculia bacterium]
MSYRILRRLAQGGFSEVFEVEDPDSALQELLVLKRLNADMSARPEVRSAFSEEAKILRELKHPNIVTFRRCYFDDRQRVCLVMEKVAGEPLDDWVRRHASQSDRVLDLCEKVLAAVDYLHHRSIPFLHLDLKPDNILVAPTLEGPQPVLIDFGIARRSGQPGLRAFTPPYAAPEQEAGRTVDCSTDVYALGQILSELLGLLDGAQASGRDEVAAIAAKATAPSRKDRYSDAGEMRIAFRRARSGVAAASRTFPRLSWRLSLRTSAIAAGALLLGVAGILLVTAREPEPQPPAAETAPATPPDRVRQRFAEIQYSFEEALIQERLDVAQYYQQARDFSDSVPEGTEDWRWMKRELDVMSIHLSQASHGGPEGESIRLLLQQKHLNYPRSQE